MIGTFRQVCLTIASRMIGSLVKFVYRLHHVRGIVEHGQMVSYLSLSLRGGVPFRLDGPYVFDVQ